MTQFAGGSDKIAEKRETLNFKIELFEKRLESETFGEGTCRMRAGSPTGSTTGLFTGFLTVSELISILSLLVSFRFSNRTLSESPRNDFQ